MSSESIFFFVILLFLSLQCPSNARSEIYNNSSSTSTCTSSCGNIHNISYPFRLKTDPINCGHKTYQLHCENNNLTVLYLNSTKYYVKAINHNNFTIRLVDLNVQKNNYSSIPHHSLSTSVFRSSESPYAAVYYNFTTTGLLFQLELSKSLVFISCPRPFTDPLYVNTSTFLPHLKGFSYVIVGPNAMDIADSCRIDMISAVSLLPKDLHNVSYITIHDSMAYGFELSWIQGCCDNFEENRCKLDEVVQDSCAVLIYRPAWLPNVILYWLGCVSYLINYPSVYIFNVYLHIYPSGLILFLLSPLFLLVTYHVVLFIFGAPCVIFFLIYRWRRRHSSMYNNIEEFLQSCDNLMPIRYSYSDIKKITKGFKDKLGEGGFALVYKGKLRSGRFVAVKVLGTKANGQDFINEVTSIGRIHHVNVVQLIGFCLEGSKQALVYEFMPKGSLDKYIFSEESQNAISKEKMYDISIGVARGIEYLHRGCDMQILHFDVKPHNVLLDENFNPKLSDFGLAKLYPTDNSIVPLTAARGTMGYMAPELFYKNIGGISHKADVYSFGMLLMEMVGRRKNLNAFIEHSSQIYFPTWVHNELSKGKDIELGSTLEVENKIMKKMMIVALWCIQFKPCDRLSIRKVLQMLEGDGECFEIPPMPSLTPQEIPKEDFGIKIQ